MIPTAKFTNLLSIFLLLSGLSFIFFAALFFFFPFFKIVLLSMFIFSFLTLESKLVEQELGLSFLSQDPGS